VLIAVVDTDTEPDKTVRETLRGTSVRAELNLVAFAVERHTLYVPGRRILAKDNENRPVVSVVVVTGAGELVPQISAATIRGPSAVTVPEIIASTDEPDSRLD
jgi:hypothetical protein